MAVPASVRTISAIFDAMYVLESIAMWTLCGNIGRDALTHDTAYDDSAHFCSLPIAFLNAMLS